MKIYRLQNAEDPGFARSMQLYAQSFPLYEQRMSASQKNILNDNEYHFLQLYEKGQLVGILLLWECDTFVYVEHFCIAPALRGQQYGQRALALLQQAKSKPILLEIDPPRDEISRRRQAFYQRCGFCNNAYSHQHPPYRPGNPPHALRILSYPRPLTQAEYDHFVRYLQERVMASAF